MAAHVLILDGTFSSCAAPTGDVLADLLRRAFSINCACVACDHELPGDIAVTPDLIIVKAAQLGAPVSLLARCREKWREIPVLLMLCGGRDQKQDQQALAECDDFSFYPFHEGEFLQRVRRLLKPSVNSAAERGVSCPQETLHFGALVGRSEKFMRAIRNVTPMADSDATILIIGQTGTGKELFSRAIHYQSRRRRYPFIPINCAALPDHLFENELFGHIKGAYTDASSAEKGLIAEAEGGTLVLDEVDTLSLMAQAKLLRFLQDGEYRPVGSARSSKANVRVIAATNTDLIMRVDARQFREDLYYRLNALSLTIPSLRERVEDVAPLASHFLDRFGKEHGRPAAALSAAALQKLMAYSWPGNIRELESVIIRALTFSRAPILTADDIDLPAGANSEAAAARSLREAKHKTIESFERHYLATLLAQHQGNVSRAAKAAGKERRSFQRLLRKHRLDRQAFTS